MSAVHEPFAPDIRVRRRLRDLPHVGGLLAAADRRPGCISPLPGGGGGFPRYPRRRFQARGAADRAGRHGSLRRRRHLPLAQLCAGARGVVVALSARARLRAAERGRLPLHLSASRIADARHAPAVGPHARARALRPRRVAVPARARPHLSRRVHVAGAADPRARRQRRHPAAGRISRRRARRLGRRRLLAPADAVLAER